jgi:L-amino acid N-acyltransferase YncA
MADNKLTKTFEIIDVDERNVDGCEYCGANPIGHARKREWIQQCLPHGLRYKTVAESTTGRTAGMIEYMPAESAWRAVHAPNHFIIHCLQVPKQHAGKGLGSLLIQECIRDARKHRMDGVVALATEDGWCTDKRIFLKNGFELVDQAKPAFELLAFKLRKSSAPSFGDWQGRAQALGTGIFLYNSKQCPFMRGDRNEARKAWLKSNYGLDAKVIKINSSQMAQANPCVWGTSGVVCNGEILNYVPGGDARFLKALKRLKIVR